MRQRKFSTGTRLGCQRVQLLKDGCSVRKEMEDSDQKQEAQIEEIKGHNGCSVDDARD